MDKLKVGSFIAEQRKIRSLTQKQFANLVGVTDKAVSRWETGKSYPDTETLEKISEIFEVSISDILSGEIAKPENKVEAADKNIIDAILLNKKTTKKWKIAFICIIILGVFLFGSLWKIFDLSEYISDMEQNHAYEMENFRSQIDSIYNNVDEQMKKEASLLSYINCEYGELDPKTNTVKMLFTVIPKAVTDETTISIKIGKDYIPMQRSGNKFVGEYNAYAFRTDEDEDLIPILTIKNGDKSENEHLEDIETKYLYQRYLGTFVADSSNFNTTLKKVIDNGNNYYEFQIQAKFLFYYATDDVEPKFKKLYILTEVNDQHLETKDVTYAVDEYGTYNDTMTFNYAVNGDDHVKAYAVLQDEYGCYHSVQLYDYTFDSSGAISFTETTEKIYSPDKKLLIQQQNET